MTGRDQASAHADPERPVLRIVRGDPTAEELAALVLTLAAASGGEESAEPVPERVHWAAPSRLLREPVAPTGWWESALPR